MITISINVRKRLYIIMNGVKLICRTNSFIKTFTRFTNCFQDSSNLSVFFPDTLNWDFWLIHLIMIILFEITSGKTRTINFIQSSIIHYREFKSSLNKCMFIILNKISYHVEIMMITITWFKLFKKLFAPLRFIWLKHNLYFYIFPTFIWSIKAISFIKWNKT